MSIYRSDKTNGDFTQISNSLLRDMRLSSKAKYLLIFMLSLPDSWVYSIEGLQTVTGMKKGVLTSALHELERNGYLLRSRTRSSDGRIGKSEWNIFEEPIRDPENNAEKTPVNNNPEQAHPPQVSPAVDFPPVENERQYNKENNKTEQTNTIDVIDRARIIRSDFERKLATKELIKDFGESHIYGIIELLTDALIVPDQLCRIGRKSIPKELVAQRFDCLEPEHIRYVLDCVAKTKKPPKNIRSYLVTSLYYAPTTMESYYDAENGRDYQPDD